MMSRLSRTLLAVLATAMAAFAVVGASVTVAGAADDGGGDGGLRITAVDATTDTVELAAFGVIEPVDAASVTVTVAGEQVPVTSVASSAAEARPTEVVVIVDTNARSAKGDVVPRIQDALRAWIAELPAGTSVAVISAGDSALVETRLTDDRDRLLAAVDGLTAKNGAALVDALDRGGWLFSDESGVVRSVLAVSTGPDVSSVATLDEAQVALVGHGAQLVTVHVGEGASPLTATMAETGGTGLAVDGPDGVTAALTDAVALATDRLLVTFDATGAAGARTSAVLTVEDRATGFSFPTGALTTNVLQLAPQPEQRDGGLTLFRSSIGLYLAVGLAFVGISLGVWSLVSMVANGETTLEGVLSRYTDGSLDPAEAEVDELIVQSAILQRAVTFSESFAEKRGFLARVESLLERASIPIRPGEGMFMLLAITVLSTAFALALFGSFVAGALTGAFAVGMTFFVVRFLGRRRFKTFEGQLPDTLQLLAGTLRAGYSLPQGLEAVSKEIADPMGQELRRAMTEARLGRDLESSLGGVAERLSSPDFAWAVMAISIQREVGGNLNELLLSVSDTMIARERLKREVSALTAEGRVSAGVLSALPPGLGFVLWLMNPAYVGVLFSETMGNVLLGLGLVSALVGLAWMKKVITVDV